MSDQQQQGQNMYEGEKNENIIDQRGVLQGTSNPDNEQNSQEQVQACDDHKPYGSCAWVDCAEQVHFIMSF